LEELLLEELLLEELLIKAASPEMTPEYQCQNKYTLEGAGHRGYMARDQIFISYSHHDKHWLDELLITLAPLVRKRRITVWDDTNIRVGKKWMEEIRGALGAANIAVLLVSRHFLASEFITETNFLRFWMRRKKTASRSFGSQSVTVYTKRPISPSIKQPIILQGR
jgi:hypothetical protein